ncbi:TPA: hypothetical protein DCX16_00410 [bacterium]|nr:hypothetical protein [bacterium]
MVEDWEINVEVRACLVKRFIDTRIVNISTNNGCVFIKGELNFTGAVVLDEHIPTVLTKLEKDIKYLKGVKDVKLEFKDWMKVNERWINIKEA